MVIRGGASYAMLLKREFFQTFTKRDLCDEKHTEALIALPCKSRDEVDSMVAAALKAAARKRWLPLTLGSCTAAPFTPRTTTTGRCS